LFNFLLFFVGFFAICEYEQREEKVYKPRKGRWKAEGKRQKAEGRKPKR